MGNEYHSKQQVPRDHGRQWLTKSPTLTICGAQLSVAQLSVAQLSVAQLSVAQLSVAQLSVAQLSVAHMPLKLFVYYLLRHCTIAW